MEIDLDDDSFINPSYATLVGGFAKNAAPRTKVPSKLVRIPKPKYDVDIATKLSDVVIQGKRGIRYHPHLTTVEGGKEYIKSRGLDPKKWKVISGDWDKDPNTPDNVIIHQEGKPRVIDGYSLSSRRPDFLYRDPKWKGEFDVIRKIEDPEVRRVKTSQLKHYLLTHSTAKSQTGEDLATYLERDDDRKYKDILHKMYLEYTRRTNTERSDDGQKAFIAQFENAISKQSPKLPSTMFHEYISNQIKLLELANPGIKFGSRDLTDEDGNTLDKLRLIREIYTTIVGRFKHANGIKDKKHPRTNKPVKVNPTQVQFLQIHDAERQKNNFASEYADIIKKYTIKKIPNNQPHPSK
jgi:hypothetical protein